MSTFSLQPPITFPDVEAMFVAWVPTVIANVPVSTRVPNPRPSRWIQVIRTGGPRAGLVVDGAQVTFECWDDSNVGAAELAATLRAQVSALGGRTAGGHLVHRVEEFSGPANVPDLHSEQPRYRWSVAVHVRA